MTTVLTAGLGLKPQRYDAALACPADGLWFDVHPENHRVAGAFRGMGFAPEFKEKHE